jgi:hypothetical protein
MGCDAVSGGVLGLAVEGLAAVRLIQIYAFACDAAATPIFGRGSKVAALRGLVGSTSAWAAATDLPDQLKAMAALDPDAYLCDQVLRLLEGLAGELTTDCEQLALLEVATATAWPPGLGWELDREAALAVAAAAVDRSVSAKDLTEIRTAHRRAVRRLKKDSVAPAQQLTLGVLLATTAMVDGGLTQGVATAIGTHVLGLHGAAATSAGLAWLGGGSLTSGGLGMAGGSLLLGLSSHAVTITSRSVATWIATRSSTAFVTELAKLDVACSMDPARHPRVLTGLHVVEESLKLGLGEIRPSSKDRRAIVIDQLRRARRDPGSAKAHLNNVKAEIPTKAERNLAASLRAIDYEIRHLNAPGWKRAVQSGARHVGASSLTRVLDGI